MKFIDLSTTIQNSPEKEQDALKTGIRYIDHKEGAAQIQAMFGVSPELLRDGEGWAVEEFTKFGTHNSTHVDAPWHYNSTIGGEPAATIDELPLDLFFSDGFVLDITSKADGDAMTVAEVEAELARIGYEIQPKDIVLVKTGRDEFIDRPDYALRGPGVTAEATRWLYEKGVRVMGIDAWGWDAPLHMQAQKALTEKKKGIFWEAHQADLPYSQIERLVNLDSLQPHGFKVACFPLKIKRGSAAPARVVAIVG